MRDLHVSSEAARAAERSPVSFHWQGADYEVAWKYIVIYDDEAVAEEIASFLGTKAKHATSKFPACWTTFSVVRFVS